MRLQNILKVVFQEATDCQLFKTGTPFEIYLFFILFFFSKKSLSSLKSCKLDIYVFLFHFGENNNTKKYQN